MLRWIGLICSCVYMMFSGESIDCKWLLERLFWASSLLNVGIFKLV